MSFTIKSDMPQRQERTFAQKIRKTLQKPFGKKKPESSPEVVAPSPPGCNCCRAILEAYHEKEKYLNKMETALRIQKKENDKRSKEFDEHAMELLKAKLLLVDETIEEERKIQDENLKREREAHDQMVSTLRDEKDKLIEELRVVKNSTMHYETEMGLQKWEMDKLYEESNDWKTAAENLQKQVDRLQSQLNQETPKELSSEMKKALAHLQEKKHNLSSHVARSLKRADKSAARYVHLCTDQYIKNAGDHKKMEFLKQCNEIRIRLDANIERIQSNSDFIHENLVPIPDFPEIFNPFEGDSLSDGEDENNTLSEAEQSCDHLFRFDSIESGAASKLSGPAMRNAMDAYILKHLLDNIDLGTSEIYHCYQLNMDGRDLIQEIIDKSEDVLKMYGTARELAAEIKIFRNFSMSHELFKFSDCDFFSTNPIKYTSLSQQTYIRKTDAFVLLQKIVENNCKEFNFQIVCAMVAMFLNFYQEEFETINQFINFSDAKFNNMENEFKTLFADSTPKIMKLDKCTFEEVLDHYKQLFPGEWDSQRYRDFEDFLMDYCKENPVEIYYRVHTEDYNHCAHILGCLKKIMDNRPEIFLPNSETGNNDHPIVVRIFEDGDKRFVPIDEIPFGTFEKSYREDLWMTTDLFNIPERVLEKSEDPKFNIQFIKVPIIRAKHRASYIMNQKGQSYILAIDAFFEMLHDWIFGLKVFQRIQTNEDWAPVELILEMLRGLYFSSEKKDQFFISTFAIENNSVLYEKAFEKLLTRPAEDVRNATATGFTEEDLKDELTHLGLTTAFPEIHDYVDKVYEHVLKNKKDDVLRTCDLFDAVYQCQMICFFKKFKKYTIFVHNQNGCSRVLETDCECRAVKLPRESFLGTTRKVLFPEIKVTFADDQPQVYTVPGASLKLSGTVMKNAVYAYVLKPLLNKVNVDTLKTWGTYHLYKDGQNLIQEIIEQSDNALRMYGTAEELAAEIKIFRNFSKSLNMFKIGDFEYHSTIPIIYTSLSKQIYICKTDVFVVLQKIVEMNCEAYKLQFIQYMVAIFLTLHEKKFEFINQFTKVPGGNFKAMNDDFKALMKKRKSKTMKLVKYTFEEVLDHYKQLIPGEWNSKRNYAFEDFLMDYCKEKPVKIHAKEYKEDYKKCADILDCLKTIIDNRPELFLPNSETGNKVHPIVIRIFEDGDKQFVPIDEIPEHLGSFEKSYRKDIWLTADISRIPESILKQSEDPEFNIQLIKVPIIRSKHRASYILNNEGNFHVLAIDAFFEILYDWIFGLKVFQRIQTNEDWAPVEMIMDLLKGLWFDWEKKDQFFISTFAIKGFNAAWETSFKTLLTRPTKDVRNVNATGFTENDLKDELNHLGLLTAFPDIQDHVKKVYAYVLKVKKGNVLRTCDLFDAVHQCQMISFFKKFPQFTKFIHNQNGCSRVVFTYCECRAEQ